MLTLIPPAQAVQRVSLPAGQSVQWHPTFIPLSPALPGLSHGYVLAVEGHSGYTKCSAV